MKTYIVNLKRSPERRKHIKYQLKTHRIPHEWVWAADGSTMTEAEVAAVVDLDAVAARPTKLSRGAIGCALSHKDIYDRMVRDKVDIALVLEDDMVLSYDIHSVLEHIQKAIKPGEVILLYYFSLYPNLPVLSSLATSPLYKNYELLYPVNEVRSTGAYVLSQETARRLSEQILPVRVEADDWMAFMKAGAIDSLRCVSPMPVFNSYAETEIQLHHVTGVRSKPKLAQRITGAIYKHRIPVLYPMLMRRRERMNRANAFNPVEITDTPSWVLYNKK